MKNVSTTLARKMQAVSEFYAQDALTIRANDARSTYYRELLRQAVANLEGK